MADKLYINWTVENWITVLLMVFAGMALIALVASALRHYTGSAMVASPATGTA
jgi:hypothetical protein